MLPTIPSISFITIYLEVKLSGITPALFNSFSEDLKKIIKDAVIQFLADLGITLTREDIEVESNTSRRLYRESRHLQNDPSFLVSYNGPNSDATTIESNINAGLASSGNTNLSGVTAQVSSVSEPTPPYVEPPSPCAYQKCNNAGKCEVTSKTEFTCVCESSFINSANGRSCVCPPGFIRKSDNRCYDPNTLSPIPLTSSPTLSPNVLSNTSAPSSFPSNMSLDEDESCNDDENAKFFLLQNTDESVKCSWLSKNKARTSKRIGKYCGLNRVKNICKSTCSFCTCTDDDSYTFELSNVSDPAKKIKGCDWLASNRKKREIRIARYCTEDFDDGALINACTKSCGLCK